MNVPAQQNQGLQLPAHLQGFGSRKLSDQVAANIGTSAPPFVSIQGNKFTLVDAAGNEQPCGAYDPSLGVYLDCVVFDVGPHLSKVWFEKTYDPNAGAYAPPDCWSDNGVGPSRQASKPQSALCVNCPKNEWGSKVSAVSGKGVKACSDQQKVAVLVPGIQTVFQLRIPPNSLKNFRGYGEQFKGQQFDIDVMITRISFEPQGVGTLLFQAVNWIDPNIMAAITEVRGRNGTDALVGRTDMPREAPPPAIAAPQQQVPVAPTTPVQPAPFQPGPPPQGFPPQPTAQPVAPAPVGMANPAPMQQPTQVAQSPSETPKTRRRRNTATTPGTPVQAPQAAPFPHPGQAPQAPTTNPGPGPAPANFGVQPGVAPDPALSAALNIAFGKPTQ